MYDLAFQKTVQLAAEALEGKRNPVVYFSGGKDSVVMLHILAFQMRKQFDVLFHREPWLTHKYEFGEKVIRDWGLTCYDYPPAEVSLWEGKDIIAFTNYYQIGVMPDGKPGCLALPKNIVDPEKSNFRGRFLCGLLDVLKRPTGTFNYPWDLAFIGHKNCDEDQIAGKVPLHADAVDNAVGPRLAFPLRHWSNEQVWEYTEKNSLPVQEDRYYKEWQTEKKDKTNNSDYFEVCIKCVDRREKAAHVDCPKFKRQVPNLSSTVPYRDIQLSYFGETT